MNLDLSIDNLLIKGRDDFDTLMAVIGNQLTTDCYRNDVIVNGLYFEIDEDGQIKDVYHA